MVFDPDTAPRSGKEFREWYFRETDWDVENPDYGSKLALPPLREWYERMTERFPDLNGMSLDMSSSEDSQLNKPLIDYSFAPHLVYASMRPEQSDEAWELAQSLAKEFGLGTYDPMSDDESHNHCIRFPDGPLPD